MSASYSAHDDEDHDNHHDEHHDHDRGPGREHHDGAHGDAHRDDGYGAASARSTCVGSRRIAVRSALAGPVGSRRPCSQLRSVPTSTCRSFANFGCESPSCERSSLIASGSTWNSRDGARSPRAISFICSMLSTSSANSFLFTTLDPLDPRPRLRLKTNLRPSPITIQLAESFLLRCRQIVFHALAVDEQHATLSGCGHVIVDHAHSAALAATSVAPARLTQAAGTLDDIAHFRMGRQALLESPVLFIRQQLSDLPGKDGCFDEHHGPEGYTIGVLYVNDALGGPHSSMRS